MSISNLFAIGKSAIFASQTALSVTSHNIANVNTAGFSRLDVVLGVSTTVDARGGIFGTGVTVSGIRRVYDSFIQNQLIGQYQNFGRSMSLEKTFGRVEQIFNDAQGLGLSQSLGEFFQAWQDLSVDPEGQAQRMALLQKANQFTRTAARMEQDLLSLRSSVNGEISEIVDRINAISAEVAALNGQISGVEGLPKAEEAHNLRDRRTMLLNELSGLVEIGFYEDAGGAVNISVGMRNLVNGSVPNSLSAPADAGGNRSLSLDGVTITGIITKGQLGGLIAARNDIESRSLFGLRRLVASVTKEINLMHASGYGLDGSTGNLFFNALQVSSKDYSAGADVTAASVTDLSQLTLDEYDVRFDALNNYSVYNRQSGALVTSGAYSSGSPIQFDGISVTITGAVSDGDSFMISPLTGAARNFGVAVADYMKVAASSSAAGVPGDNSNAVSIAALADAVVSDLGASFQGFYQGLVSFAGTSSRAAADSLALDQRLLDDMHARRESISGVSLDEEAANLIKFQRAFEAGAKLISVTDELMETILQL